MLDAECGNGRLANTEITEHTENTEVHYRHEPGFHLEARVAR